MKDILDMDEMEVGFDIPAKVGMDEADIQTPCLVLDLDALERNIVKMGDYARDHGMRHRIHGKMHKSVDVALLQEKLGGAVGVCCQKVSEAEVFAPRRDQGRAGVEPGARARRRSTGWRGCRRSTAAVTIVCVDDVRELCPTFRRRLKSTAPSFRASWRWTWARAVAGR